jgi:hypothetical protein
VGTHPAWRWYVRPGDLQATATASIGLAAATISPRVGSAPASAVRDRFAGFDTTATGFDAASATGLDAVGGQG